MGVSARHLLAAAGIADLARLIIAKVLTLSADSPTSVQSAFNWGDIGAFAPDRRGDLARLGLRAMVGGTLVAFMNGAVASILL